MSQFDLGTIDPNTKDGASLASDLNNWRDALNSLHRGTTAPTYALAGTLWVDDSADPTWELKFYDGAGWTYLFTIDTANNKAHTEFKNNTSATTTPTVTDDSNSSYSVGSNWIDTTNNNTYVCVDNSAAAAIWVQTNNPNQSELPVGSEIIWPLATPPTGFLEEDGSAISRTTYADLFAVIGTIYGVGDGSTTFNLPDARGEFIRIWDHAAGNDPDAASRTDRGDGTTGDDVGTKQVDELKSHNHTGARRSSSTYVAHGASYYYATGNTTTGNTGGDETRPRNVNRMLCIKY